MDLSRRAQLDTLLTYGAEALDLTPTQYEDAVQKYQSVGAWLNKPDSLLVAANPMVFPQGSIAIGTATKPVRRDEFDLDLVCQLQIADRISPAQLKRAIGQRLRENAVYRERLEEKNRCWRIVYAGDFYMDILPGRPDPRFADTTALLIPDKELSAWKESDPKGYAAWFTERSRLSMMASMGVRAGVAAPPPAPDASTKTPLQLAVQIFKRHRDLSLGDDEDAPISIIITTLAARAYVGQDSVYDTLQHLLMRMPTFIETDSAGNSVVSNPVNPLENFADKWRDYPRKRQRFFDWIQAASHQLNKLAGATLPQSVEALTPLIGARPGTEAVRQYGSAVHEQRTAGLRAAAATGALGSTSARARVIPTQTFFGGPL
jgi:hypothetical protein